MKSIIFISGLPNIKLLLEENFKHDLEMTKYNFCTRCHNSFVNLRDFFLMLKAVYLLRLLFFRILLKVHSETESARSLLFYMFILTVKSSFPPYYHYIERQKKTFLILTNRVKRMLSSKYFHKLKSRISLIYKLEN